MKKKFSFQYLLFCLLAVALTSEGTAAIEISSRYSKIIYNNYDELETFNNEIFLGKYSYLLKNKNITTLEDEIAFKIDFIVDKVKTILDMYPDNIEFKVAICGSTKELQKNYEIIYGKQTDFIAFYSPKINFVYFSVTDVDFETLAHEFAHIVAEQYFKVSPPVKIHEILANYVEETICQ